MVVEADRRSGKVREPAEEFFHPLAEDVTLDDAGYVLKAVNVAGTLVLDKAAVADFPYAVNVQSTRDALSIVHPPNIFLDGDNKRLDTIDVVDAGEVALKLGNNNLAINFGEPVRVHATNKGKVDAYIPTVVGNTSASNESANIILRFTELGKIVGYVREKVSEGGGGEPSVDKVLVKLTIKNVPTIA